MRHFLQYHNAEVQGPLHLHGRPGIFTAKPVQALLGDQIWLVSGEGRPRTYYLNGTFQVTELSHAGDEDQMNEVWGSDAERWFQMPVRIDTEPWFEELRRATGNFAFGLQRIKDVRITQGLRDASLDLAEEPIEASTSESGSGPFGTPEANKLIEVAAVEAVTEAYRSDGWTVVSHENRKYGYDLHCTNAQVVHHVEVKGVRGRDCSFILTANEMDFSCERNSFRLCVVTNALDHKHRKIEMFTASELASKFDFEPLAFAARLKR